jgi:hypothetical protein
MAMHRKSYTTSSVGGSITSAVPASASSRRFFFSSVTGIKSNAFGRSHGWLRNWGHTYICPASNTMPLGVVMDGCATWAAIRHVLRNLYQCVSRDLGSIRRSAKTAAQPHLSSTRCTCSSQASMLEEASFHQAPRTSTTELSCGVSRGGAGGQGGRGISILLGSAWNLPLVWKSASGHAKGAGGETLAAHNGLTGRRCEHLTRTRGRVASASSKDAPGV